MTTNISPTFNLSRRASGVLLHPTSLPGPYGVGDLGPEARKFIDRLAEAEQSWWQMLPLTDPGEWSCPYQGRSAFAGNPLLISPDDLQRDGLLEKSDLQQIAPSTARANFEKAAPFKHALLQKAWQNFTTGAAKPLRDPFQQFCADESRWLNDYALFVTLCDLHPHRAWQDWPPELAQRQPAVLAAITKEHADTLAQHRFIQFLYARQQRSLKKYANDHHIGLIGDLPIFVAAHSADVWEWPTLFKLDQNRKPEAVAGVPPDMFSEKGQTWGNPLYCWDVMKRDGYRWWTERMADALRQFDLVRIDHFRAFAAAWEIPAAAPDASFGQWIPGPGADLFEHFQKHFGPLPVVAEDLGLITPDVIELRDRFHLAGMRVLQFAFSEPLSPHLPAHYERNTVVYTGTHDNDTTQSWFQKLTPDQQHRIAFFAPDVTTDPAKSLMRMAWLSVANLAIVPMQDVLSLGGDARMNLPGTMGGNWDWRLTPTAITPQAMSFLKDLTILSDRGPIAHAAHPPTPPPAAVPPPESAPATHPPLPA